MTNQHPLHARLRRAAHPAGVARRRLHQRAELVPSQPTFSSEPTPVLVWMVIEARRLGMWQWWFHVRPKASEQPDPITSCAVQLAVVICHVGAKCCGGSRIDRIESKTLPAWWNGELGRLDPLPGDARGDPGPVELNDRDPRLIRAGPGANIITLVVPVRRWTISGSTSPRPAISRMRASV